MLTGKIGPAVIPANAGILVCGLSLQWHMCSRLCCARVVPRTAPEESGPAHRTLHLLSSAIRSSLTRHDECALINDDRLQ